MEIAKTSSTQYLGSYYQTKIANTKKFNQLLTEKATNTSADKTVSVQWGDTVWGFAQKYGTNISSIAEKNNLADPNYILAGQKLVIPITQKSTAAKSETANTTSNLESTQNDDTTAVSAVNTTVSHSNSNSNTKLSADEAAAKDWIVEHESGGNYNARNGKYIGKYQLDKAYLNGDYSATNQDKVAAQYVAQRYGSWVNAMKHWKIHHWY
jgi:LysM repeat protein